MVQLKPSRKREMRGWAVVVKSACCVVLGEWTWSKVNTCFFPGVAGEERAVAEPEAAGAAETASTETMMGVVA